MAVGANSVRPPLFAYVVCTNSTPRNSSKRDVVFLQSRNCAAPLQVFGQVSAAAKSLRSLRIYVLLWDRIAVQIVLLRYFFCLISYFYMLLILQSAPSRLSPNEALPHTPLGALPLDPTSPLAPGLSVRFISRFARCLGAALLIPHSSLNSTPHLSSYCILILFKQSTLLGVEQLVNDIANSRSVQPTSLQKSIAFISKYLKSQT